MSEQPSALHAAVHAHFRKAFGEPLHVLGKDHHWSIQAPPYWVPINILVNGSVREPAVWIFDPYDRENGVFKTAITKESEAIEVIKQIQDRVNRVSSIM